MGVLNDENELREVMGRAMRRILSNPSVTYPQQVDRLRRLRNAFHDELATVFAPAFNDALQAMTHEDIDAKRALCSAANETLKSLGLSIRDPKTRHPAILVADFRSADEEAGRFRLEVREPSGRVIRTLSSPTLPKFELCEAPIRQESFARKFRGNDPNSPSR